MPLYEYKCSNCQHQFELLQSFSADKNQECPECGSVANRLLSLGSFILKGGGWYATSARPKPCEEKKVEAPAACADKCDSCSIANS